MCIRDRFPTSLQFLLHHLQKNLLLLLKGQIRHIKVKSEVSLSHSPSKYLSTLEILYILKIQCKSRHFKTCVKILHCVLETYSKSTLLLERVTYKSQGFLFHFGVYLNIFTEGDSEEVLPAFQSFLYEGDVYKRQQEFCLCKCLQYSII